MVQHDADDSHWLFPWYVYHRAPTDSGCFGGMLGSGGPVVTSSGVLQYYHRP